MQDRTFAQRLKAAFDANPDMTEAGLAVKAGLSDSVVRKILAGTTKNPRVDTARKICAAMGTTLEEFMGLGMTAEEREINQLVAQLSVERRRQLLGYGQALLAAQDQTHRE